MFLKAVLFNRKIKRGDRGESEKGGLAFYQPFLNRTFLKYDKM